MEITHNNKMLPEVENWKTSMWAATINAMRESRHDILNLYLKLERASKKYIETGKMPEGSTFKVPLENGTYLNISFFKQYSTVDVELPNGQKRQAVSREDSYKKEYRYLLATSDTLETVDLGIGPAAPREFHEMLINAKVGDVFVFDRGQSFVYEGKLNNLMSFVRTSDEVKTPSFDKISESERFSIDINDPKSVQHAYRRVKDPYTFDLKMRIENLTNARQILNKLLIGEEDTKIISLGPNKLVAQKNKDGKGLVYYDQTGAQISEEKALLMLAWLEARPNEVEIKRIKPVLPEDAFNDTVFVRTIDEMMTDKDFVKAANLAMNYCQVHGDTLELNMSSYVKNHDEYEAVSFLFKVDTYGVPKIYKVHYEDNSFDKNLLLIKETTIDEFSNYCLQKYDDRFAHVQSEVLAQCHEKFPEYSGKNFDITVARLAKDRLAKEQVVRVDVNRSSLDTIALQEALFEDKTDLGN